MWYIEYIQVYVVKPGRRWVGGGSGRFSCYCFLTVPPSVRFFIVGLLLYLAGAPKNKKSEKYEYKTPLGCNRGLEALLILYTTRWTMC